MGHTNAQQHQSASPFGQGTGQIYMDDLGCNENDVDLFECGYGGWGNHDCGHSEDVGVTCTSASAEYDASIAALFGNVNFIAL